MMMRLLILLFVSSLAGCSTDTTRPPNILFIMVDDLGPEWISAYGGEDIETPNIDALAEEGMMFMNAYSMPQCTPTRVTLLTGQYPYRHGWTNHWDVPRWGAGAHYDPDLNYSFPRLLREAGYATAIAGKWQINDFRVQPNILDDHGFDEWAVWTGYETMNPPSAERYQDAYIHTREGSRTYEGEFGPDIYTDFLIEFLEKHQDQPMMLYFPMALTHTPLIPTPHEPNAETNQDRHEAMVRYVDHLVGRLTQKVDELGLRKHTLIFFTTDNGTTRGIEGRLNGRVVRGGKGSLGENGVRQPFIVRGPTRVLPNVQTDALIDFSDLFPTFAELAEATIPTNLSVDGHSFASVLSGDSDDSPRNWIMAMGFGPANLKNGRVVPVQPYTDRAIRGKQFKLWMEEGHPSAFYDLLEDPGETNNLLTSEEPAHQEAKIRLLAVAKSFPETDDAPRYNALPPQPWDRKE